MPDSDTAGSDADTRQAFAALCDGVLGAQVGYLVPLGALAPLAGPPLAYPDGLPNPANWQAGDAAGLRLPGVSCLPVDPAQAGGAVWAVPLWDGRGLVGSLLLGSKAGWRDSIQRRRSRSAGRPPNDCSKTGPVGKWRGG